MSHAIAPQMKLKALSVFLFEMDLFRAEGEQDQLTGCVDC